jgi:hypothetical protein
MELHQVRYFVMRKPWAQRDAHTMWRKKRPGGSNRGQHPLMTTMSPTFLRISTTTDTRQIKALEGDPARLFGERHIQH